MNFPLNQRMQFSVEHIGLPACDPAALRDWYVNKLGAECLAPKGVEPPFFIRPPGSVAMFEIYAATATSQRVDDNGLAGWRHMALKVDSIEAARAELEARGVKFVEAIKPAAGGGRVLFFKDHEGNLLHLVDRPADTKIK
jgi:catechol 2,3-dioxygenase-like lactoylglutathione lyase family enzyme